MTQVIFFIILILLKIETSIAIYCPEYNYVFNYEFVIRHCKMLYPRGGLQTKIRKKVSLTSVKTAVLMPHTVISILHVTMEYFSGWNLLYM